MAESNNHSIMWSLLPSQGSWSGVFGRVVQLFSDGKPRTIWRAEKEISKYILGGGNSNILLFSPLYIWGRWTHFDEHIFSDGLVQPPTRRYFWSHYIPLKKKVRNKYKLFKVEFFTIFCSAEASCWCCWKPCVQWDSKGRSSRWFLIFANIDEVWWPDPYKIHVFSKESADIPT